LADQDYQTQDDALKPSLALTAYQVGRQRLGLCGFSFHPDLTGQKANDSKRVFEGDDQSVTISEATASEVNMDAKEVGTEWLTTRCLLP
jgi:hypothetical protein